MKSLALFVVIVPALAAAKAPVSLLEEGGSIASNQVHMMGILAAMAVVPFVIMMVTSFSKIVVVLSIVRSAIGTQQAPPTMVITGLAAVLSITIMMPTFERMWAIAKVPTEGNEASSQLLSRAESIGQPLRDFLEKHGSAEERARFVELAKELRNENEIASVSARDLSIVVPAFVITELKEAFVIGFLVFLPFLVLDMLIANVLLALGMQTLSPSQVSLPFKILLFVAVDGWSLLAKGLILAYR